jgi:hypothetical protein
MSFQKIALISVALVLASCSGLPAKNYDARKNNAKQYDFDSSHCAAIRQSLDYAR